MSGKTIEIVQPEEPVDLLIIAGEHSGDEHAARILNDLKVIRPGVRVAALGGESIRAAGAHLVFNLVEHSVIGFTEVVKNYAFFKALHDSILEWIERVRPPHLLFVDYPGLNLRLASALKKRNLSRKGGGKIGLWYYIAPQVWAWKAKRRFKMADILDGLACILPFEEDFFADTELPVRFVGHPYIDATYPLPLNYNPEAPVLLLPGSRVQQVRQVFPAQLAAYEYFLKEMPNRRASVIYPSGKILDELEQILNRYPRANAQIQLQRNEEEMEGSAALMSSGTMSLACALAGIPGAIVQKFQPMTYYLARMLVRIEFIGLANIILKRELVPEYIQFLNSNKIGEELVRCLCDPHRLECALWGARELKSVLSARGVHPSGQWLADCLDS